ncbi:MAG TPA: hypothetical protein VKY92_00435 [Verrucomicrobiae bacterium]|nr:hypothetical protein [Verrucomicrobiae bacterium]
MQTKQLLKISIFGNLLLAALLAAVAFEHKPTPRVPSPIEGSSNSAVNQPYPNLPSDSVHQTRFSWRQLESTNYGTYVSNLRAIGCPEQTVRDIISADVHALFELKRAQAGSSSQDAAHWTVPEEKKVVAFVVGDPGLQEAPGVVSRQWATPLVLAPIDPGTVQLDPEQQAALFELRGQFVEQVGGTNQDPADPDYAAKYQNAQAESDRLLRGMIGVNAFMRLQNEQP